MYLLEFMYNIFDYLITDTLFISDVVFSQTLSHPCNKNDIVLKSIVSKCNVCMHELEFIWLNYCIHCYVIVR